MSPLPHQVRWCLRLEQESALGLEGSLGKCLVSVECLGQGRRSGCTGKAGPSCRGGKRETNSEMGVRGPSTRILGQKETPETGSVAGTWVRDGDTEVQNTVSAGGPAAASGELRGSPGALTPHLVLGPRHRALEEVTSG